MAYDAKLVLTPYAGHIFQTDQPQITGEAILNFLKAQSSGAGGRHPSQRVFATDGQALLSKATSSCSRRQA